MTRILPVAVAAFLLPLAAHAGMWDGNYSGKLVQVGSNAMSCSKTAGVQMNVAGDTLTYHHFSNATFSAKVGADGSFKDQQLNQYGGSRSATMQTLSGTIGPGGVSATVTSQYCNYQLTLKRQG
jgi:hypothetical protein